MIYAITLFAILQWIMIVGLLVFIKEKPIIDKSIGGNNDEGFDPDDIVLPPLPGIDYPSTLKEKYQF